MSASGRKRIGAPDGSRDVRELLPFILAGIVLLRARDGGTERRDTLASWAGGSG